MKRPLLILNIFALALGALAPQSCEDTSDGYRHGYYNRNYYNGGDYNERSYSRGYYPSDHPSIDVHL
jgi:hypothetical protein